MCCEQSTATVPAAKEGEKSHSRILLMVELTSLLLSPSCSCHLQKRVGISLWNLLIFFVFHSFLFRLLFERVLECHQIVFMCKTVVSLLLFKISLKIVVKDYYAAC